MMKKIALVLVSFLITSVSIAEPISVKRNILRAANGPNAIGGCEALVDRWIGLGCTNRVSFDCDGGEGTAKDQAFSMFDSVQMAFALGREIILTMDTDTKVGASNQCLVNKTEVIAPAP